MDYKELSAQKHAGWKGKFEVVSRVPLNNTDDLSLAYTPGVAAPCLLIKDDPDLSFTLTRRWNTVLVVTDGTAVLGLGDIGPVAGMPVMEGKCVLFKHFADIDAIPLCIDSKDTDEIVKVISLISGSFGGINLEDIAAPRCFEIEAKLKEVCPIPIFHDDQHGTAVVLIAAIMNALKISGKKPDNTQVVLSGAGAAGVAIAKLMQKSGFTDITLLNSKGAVTNDKQYSSNDLTELSKTTNPQGKRGQLKDVIVGADIFIGVSAPNILTGDMVRTMANNPIVFALSNPDPEILPEKAFEAGAKIVGTGRSDYPNQINNVLAFPGIFRGALDVRASDISDNMKLAAAYALSSLVTDKELESGIVIPSPFNENICPAVSKAVADAAKKDGLAALI